MLFIKTSIKYLTENRRIFVFLFLAIFILELFRQIIPFRDSSNITSVEVDPVRVLAINTVQAFNCPEYKHEIGLFHKARGKFNIDLSKEPHRERYHSLIFYYEDKLSDLAYAENFCTIRASF